MLYCSGGEVASILDMVLNPAGESDSAETHFLPLILKELESDHDLGIADVFIADSRTQDPGFSCGSGIFSEVVQIAEYSGINTVRMIMVRWAIENQMGEARSIYRVEFEQMLKNPEEEGAHGFTSSLYLYAISIYVQEVMK